MKRLAFLLALTALACAPLLWSGCGGAAAPGGGDENVQPPSVEVELTLTEAWLGPGAGSVRAVLIDAPFSKIEITVTEQPQGSDLTLDTIYIENGRQVNAPTHETETPPASGTEKTYVVSTGRVHCDAGHYVLSVTPYGETDLFPSGYAALDYATVLQVDVGEAEHRRVPLALDTLVLNLPG